MVYHKSPCNYVDLYKYNPLNAPLNNQLFCLHCSTETPRLFFPLAFSSLFFLRQNTSKYKGSKGATATCCNFHCTAVHLVAEDVEGGRMNGKNNPSMGWKNANGVRPAFSSVFFWKVETKRLVFKCMFFLLPSST